MQMSVQEVAGMLAMDEEKVYQWAKEGRLPAVLVNEQYRFNHAEILQWAAERNRGLVIPAAEPSGVLGPHFRLAAALARGGIHYGVAGGGLGAFLEKAVGLLPLPEGVDRADLLEVLLARELAGSTGVGDGIAVPHVRFPIVAEVQEPLVSLCFSGQPLDFRAPDRKPVTAVFLVLSPAVRSHLQVLARLFACLQAPDFRKVVMDKAPADAILRACAEAEKNRD